MPDEPGAPASGAVPAVPGAPVPAPTADTPWLAGGESEHADRSTIEHSAMSPAEDFRVSLYTFTHVL